MTIVVDLEAELKRCAAELEQTNQELRQFAYASSHDLQESLHIVISCIQLLAQRYRDKLDVDTDDLITHAVDEANRMQNLLDDLLAYSRVDIGGKEFEPVDGEYIFDRALADLGSVIKESRVIVDSDALPTVTVDGSQLVQLFQRLISNAIKFQNAEPPRVHVSAQRESAEWVFSISDNGIGIDPEFADRIFIMFQRLHSREEYPGSGIGLAICRKIISRHSGRIWVESQPGKGSTFYFTIPDNAGDK